MPFISDRLKSKFLKNICDARWEEEKCWRIDVSITDCESERRENGEDCLRAKNPTGIHGKVPDDAFLLIFQLPFDRPGESPQTHQSPF
jgi:hypothetical protein